jgi:hypothetical protein
MMAGQAARGAGILTRRALPMPDASLSLGRLGATPDFHHGLQRVDRAQQCLALTRTVQERSRPVSSNVQKGTFPVPSDAGPWV